MMKKTFLTLALIFPQIFAINATSGGKLSKNQSAMDVVHYDLRLKVDPSKNIIGGSVIISFVLLEKIEELEIDLLKKFNVFGTIVNGMSVAFKHEKNKILIENPELELFKTHSLEIKYSGKPPSAKNPPWDGGLTWKRSKDGQPWISVSCQKNGAYIWYPCKEHPSDKADSADITITVPQPLVVASNGLLQSTYQTKDRWQTWHWKTKYPISPYNINFTAGNFITVEKTGYILNSPLYMVYYVLPESQDGADALLREAEGYLNFYANHFGQYPWMDEKFGLVETPYWGMEHQTINAYGNKYKKTKLGYDFLMFHEMGHEWWGNYLSVADWADFWIHEGFDTYAEALFIEEKYGLSASRNFVEQRYKKNITNEWPVVPSRNSTTENKAGSDIYYKGAHILHTLRYLIGKDILEESLKEFLYMPKEWSKNQTSTEEFMSLIQMNSGKDLNWFFKQYLFKGQLPTLNIKTKNVKDKKFIDYWWEENGFFMPLEISFKSFDGIRERTLELNNSPKRIAIPASSEVSLDPNGWLLFQTKETSNF